LEMRERRPSLGISFIFLQDYPIAFSMILKKHVLYKDRELVLGLCF